MGTCLLLSSCKKARYAMHGPRLHSAIDFVHTWNAATLMERVDSMQQSSCDTTKDSTSRKDDLKI